MTNPVPAAGNSTISTSFSGLELWARFKFLDSTGKRRRIGPWHAALVCLLRDDAYDSTRTMVRKVRGTGLPPYQSKRSMNWNVRANPNTFVILPKFPALKRV